MKRFALAGLALVAGLAISCQRTTEHLALTESKAALSEASADTAYSGTLTDSEVRAAADEKAPTPPPQGRPGKQSQIPVPMDWEKKIVRNADITMQVKDFGATGKLIKNAVQLMGGYIAGSDEQQLTNQIRADVTIRVPREKFDELLERIQLSGDSLLRKEITSQDLTEEFVDTKERIRAKEKVRERYYEFLKKAGTIKDVLAVQADLRELDEEIESATGRTNYISHEAALNTIHLVYFQMLSATDVPDVAPGFITELNQSFKGGLDFLKNLLLVLVALWPLTIVILLIVWIIRRQRKSKVATMMAPANAH